MPAKETALLFFESRNLIITGVLSVNCITVGPEGHLSVKKLTALDFAATNAASGITSKDCVGTRSTKVPIVAEKERLVLVFVSLVGQNLYLV